MTPPPAVLPRYVTLDHWRGLAALAVVMFHAFYPWAAQRAPAGLDWLSVVADQGYLGVHLFFVISGYCIAQLAWRELRSGRDLPGFLRNRFLRIFPPYLAACFVAAALALAALPFNHAALFSSSSSVGALPHSMQALLSHALLADHFLDRPTYLLVAWTLSWELSFYLLAALLVWLGLRFGTAAVMALGLLVALAGTSPVVAATVPPLAGWAEFMCGACVLAALVAAQERRATWPWLGAIMLLGIAGFVQSGRIGTLPFAAIFALALFRLHRHDQRLASLPALHWLGSLGVMSYSIYLVHAPFVSASRNLFGRLVPTEHPIFLIGIFLSILVGLAASLLFFRWFEAPLENWRKSLGRPRPSSLSPP